MSKQSVSKPGKVVPFPGTQPFMYKGRKVSVHIGVWPSAKGAKTFRFDDENDCYLLLVTAVSFERAMIAVSQYAEEVGIYLEGG